MFNGYSCYLPMVAWKDKVSSYSYMHFSAEPSSATSFPELFEEVQSSSLSSNTSTSDLVIDMFLCALPLMLSIFSDCNHCSWFWDHFSWYWDLLSWYWDTQDLVTILQQLQLRPGHSVMSCHVVNRPHLVCFFLCPFVWPWPCFFCLCLCPFVWTWCWRWVVEDRG